MTPHVMMTLNAELTSFQLIVINGNNTCILNQSINQSGLKLETANDGLHWQFPKNFEVIVQTMIRLDLLQFQM